MIVFTNDADDTLQMRYFLRRDNRIQKRSDFQRTYAAGKCYRHKYLHLFIAPRESAGNTRLGITATKKLGKAVLRNKMKRRVREAFRLELPALKPGFDVVVNFSRNSSDADFAAIQKQLRRLLEEAGLYELGARRGE